MKTKNYLLVNDGKGQAFCIAVTDRALAHAAKTHKVQFEIIPDCDREPKYWQLKTPTEKHTS